MGDSTIEIRKRGGFSHVPDAILENKLLSLDTRAVLGWLVGRPEGWTIRVEWMRTRLGISEFQWKRIKNEMQQQGYFTQVKRRAKNGKIEWVQIVSEEPIPKTTSHEPAIGEEITHGKTMHGGVGDKAQNRPEDVTKKIKQKKAAGSPPLSGGGAVLASQPRKKRSLETGVVVWTGTDDEKKHARMLAEFEGGAIRDAAAHLTEIGIEPYPDRVLAYLRRPSRAEPDKLIPVDGIHDVVSYF